MPNPIVDITITINPKPDVCPKCGGTNTTRRTQDVTTFLARTLAVCECGAAWEPIDTAWLTDPANPYSAFKTPCDNCAFRPGSRERRNKRSWRSLITVLTTNHESEFHCHKGVPIFFGPQKPNRKSNIGFDYRQCPRRPCAGWLALQRGIFARALRVIRDIRERKTRRPA